MSIRGSHRSDTEDGAPSLADREMTVPPDEATSPGATIGVCRNREAL
jgi:hypothetical protein